LVDCYGGQPADDGGRAIGSRGNFYRDDTRTYLKMNFFFLFLSTAEEKRENRFLLTGKAIDQLQKFFCGAGNQEKCI
jgi:hypothetical protein